MIAASLLFGRLSDQVGRRRMLLPGLVLSALSALVFLLADSLTLLIVGRVLSGFSAGIFTGTATATLIDFAPVERRGRATLAATIANMGGLGCGPLSSFFVVAYVALSLPVVGVGVLARATGLRPAGLIFAGVVAALCAAVLVLLRRRHGIPVDQAARASGSFVPRGRSSATGVR